MTLIDGKVEITPKEDGRIDPIQLLKATYDSGVSVAEMNVIASGRITRNESGGIALQVAPSQSFAIAHNDLSSQLEAIAGSPNSVTVRGLLYQKSKKTQKQTLPASLTLTVLEIQQKE